MPSELTATSSIGADGAAARAIRVVRLGAATGGAEITGFLMGGAATAGDAVGACGAFTGFGAARALGGAIADFGSAGGGTTGVGAFRIAATFGADGGLGRFTAGAFGAAGTREATFGGSINFDFGTATGRTLGVSGRRMGISTLVSRFSRVIEAGAGGDTARVGAKAGGTVGRLVTPRDWSGFGSAADVTVLGRFNVERGIWRGGFAK
ncbi:MAG: hypothetical protein VX639_05005 [Pseudomonadota bacterium]|nr:hypothetical protein [Pseudomonadota bacterium]